MKSRVICFAIAVFVLFSFVGCSSLSKHPIDTENNSVKKNKGTVDAADALNNSPVPFASEDRLYYHSKNEFVEAIENNTDKDSALYGITDYFMPSSVEEGYDLSFVFVKHAYIAFQFNKAGCESLYQEGQYYLFEWYRKMLGSDLEKEMSRYKEGTIEKYENYYIWENDNIKSVYWEEHGLMFHAIVPSYVPDDSLSDFCTAVHVSVDNS